MKKSIGIILTVILAGSILIGCVAYVRDPQPYSSYAPGPPPETIVEVRPLIPFPEAVWLAGFWAFHSGNWVWNSGGWDRRPHPRARWNPGKWHHDGPRGYGWRPGHWR